MNGITNLGKIRMLDLFLTNITPPNGFAIALVTGNFPPGPDTNVLSDLEEIVTGNGYSAGGVAIERSAVGFPTSTEDDTTDQGNVTMKDITFTAAGGIIPSSGDGIQFFVLTDDNATIPDREVFAYVEFSGDPKIIEDTGILSILGFKQSLIEPT